MAERELIERLLWLCRLRWLAAFGIVTLSLGATRVLGFPLPEGLLVVTGLVVALYNVALVTWLRQRAAQRGPLPRGLATVVAHLQIGLDLVALTLVIHFTGGVGSPLGAYLVFHMIIASTLLSVPAAVAQATFASALYAGLVTLEALGVVRHHPLGFLRPDLYRSPQAALLVLVVGSMLYAAVYLAGSIVERLRQRERELAALTTRLEAEMSRTQEAYQQLEAAERLQVGYMQRVSHELRRPLAAAGSLLRALAESGATLPAQRAAEVVARATTRLQQAQGMVADLLLLSQAREAPRQEPPAWVDPQALLEEVADEMADRARQGEVALEVCPASPGEMIWTQPEGLRTVLRNLLANALRYTPPGGRVELAAGQEAGLLRLTVSDTGVGIAPEELPRIFEEFYRAPTARRLDPEGTGLGLAIVRTIIETFGGRCEVDSFPGRGTTFTLHLPLRYPEME